MGRKGAGALEDDLVHVPELRRVGERARERLLARDVDVLTASGVEAVRVRRHRARRARRAAQRPELRHAHAQRRTVRVAGEIGEAAERRAGEVGRGEVAVGAVLPERRYRDVDERGVEHVDVVVTEAERIEVAGAERFDEEVGGCDEPSQRLAHGVRRDVERGALLVRGVELPEEAALDTGLVVVEGADAAGRVAGDGFDLDHLRAKVGEDAPAEDAPVVGEVYDAVRGEHRQGRPG